MDNKTFKVDKILSFLPRTNGSDYFLIEVEEVIKNKLIQLIDKLERIPQVYLCLRGDSKRNLNEHNNLFDEDLSKIFIVGEKARSSLETSPNPQFQPIVSDHDTTLKQIESLANEISDEILSNSNSPSVSGKIPKSFIDTLSTIDGDELDKWKLFLLSFLHNSGKIKSFKEHSPFISLTYGHDKYTISRKFALSRCPHKKGILFLYCLNAGWPYYIKTIDFGKQLKKFGISWYRDINREIMLINGMYPHHLLGVFETEPLKNSRFIINPWLYKLFHDNQEYDYTIGIPINQDYFQEFAQKLGYQNYFFHYINNEIEYASVINQLNHGKIIRP